MFIRTHTCGELRLGNAGATVRLNGWVNAYRDHGSLIFIDVRDRMGLTQLVFDPEHGADAATMAEADRLRHEDVISVEGFVRERIGGENPKLETGKIEVVVRRLAVLNKTENPPFLPDDLGNLPNEELRLRYRYMDLRRPAMQRTLAVRHRVSQVTRRYFDERGFLEIETPILYKSTPEGAREFLVPSRHQPGHWFALPQSPQLFKQILMVAGCDRYVQLCRCFRDEDPRADRQAEFTQVDVEMSFVRREQVMEVIEGYVRKLWGEVAGHAVPPMERMTYREAMERFGIDRPDTRYGLEIRDVSLMAGKSEAGFFKEALAKGAGLPAFSAERGVVKALRAPGGSERLTRKMTDGYHTLVRGFGAGGCAAVKVVRAAEGGGIALETGIAKFLGPVKDELAAGLGLEPGDTVLFVADAYGVCTKAMGELRQAVARDMGLIPAAGSEGGPWNFLWVVDFPMFERNKETGKWSAMHHPFTAPRDDQTEAFVAADPGDETTIEGIVSAGYDMVLNGQEIAGGSIRIHDRRVQSKVFELLGMSPEQAREKFSFLLDALAYGAPPHGGIALGLDRLVMNFVGTTNIRDVIAFPKTQIAQDLMTGAPGVVGDEQLREVHVRNVVPG